MHTYNTIQACVIIKGQAHYIALCANCTSRKYLEGLRQQSVHSLFVHCITVLEIRKQPNQRTCGAEDMFNSLDQGFQLHISKYIFLGCLPLEVDYKQEPATVSP